MKRPTVDRSTMKELVLAHQRAEIRALLEQLGWTSRPEPVSDEDASSPRAIPDNVIPFPIPRR